MSEQTSKRATEWFWAAVLLLPRKYRHDLEIIFKLVRKLQTVNSRKRQKLLELWLRYQDCGASELYIRKRDSELRKLIKSVALIATHHQLPKNRIRSLIEAYAAETDETYVSVNQTMRWLYGSAESIGVLCAHILHLPPPQIKQAELYSRSFGYLMMVMSLASSAKAGQHHFSLQELKRHGMSEISVVLSTSDRLVFDNFVMQQLKLISRWQHGGEHQLQAVPRAVRPALRLLFDGARYQMTQLSREPRLIYTKPPLMSALRLRVMIVQRRLD